MSDDPEKKEAELQARLAKLDEALKARDAREAERAPKVSPEARGFAKAMSAGLGWLIDRWTGAKPWGLVIFLGLGAAAGFWNVYRLALRQQAQDELTKDEG